MRALIGYETFWTIFSRIGCFIRKWSKITLWTPRKNVTLQSESYKCKEMTHPTLSIEI